MCHYLRQQSHLEKLMISIFPCMHCPSIPPLLSTILCRIWIIKPVRVCIARTSLIPTMLASLDIILTLLTAWTILGSTATILVIKSNSTIIFAHALQADVIKVFLDGVHSKIEWLSQSWCSILMPVHVLSADIGRICDLKFVDLSNVAVHISQRNSKPFSALGSCTAANLLTRAHIDSFLRRSRMRARKVWLTRPC